MPTLLVHATTGGVVCTAATESPACQTSSAKLALSRRMVLVAYSRETFDAGALMSYGPDNIQATHRAAALVDKILKGAKPRDLPVEQPSKFELGINLRAAKTLSLTIPQSVLARADHVIQ